MKTKQMCFPLILHLLFLILSAKYYTCYGADAISGDEYLSGDQTLISKQGIFELGFFKAGQSANFYIGIWYKQVSEKTIVWVANRETPVKDKYSSFLRIQGANLMLFNEYQHPIWSTDVDYIRSSSFLAILRDDGNFALIEGSSNSSIWESFDHPTDTWLPGAKLAYNKNTDESQSLTSWKNSEDPAPGIFSFHLQGYETNFYLGIIWNGSHGTSRYTVYESDLRDLCSNNINFSWGANETYLTYNLINPETTCRLVMDVSGKIKAINSSEPKDLCGVIPNYCGKFSVCSVKASTSCSCLAGFEPNLDEDWRVKDFSGGCKRKANLQCVSGSGKGKKYKFKVYQSMTDPLVIGQKVHVESIEECEYSCLSSCSCAAYAYNSGNTLNLNSECELWDESIFNLEQLSNYNGGRTLYIRVFPSGSRRNKRTLTVIGALMGCIALVFLLLALILSVFWRRCRRMSVVVAEEGSSLGVFSYRDLQNATKNFCHKLGAGGFGSVYKGILPDSSVVAVKMLEGVGQGEKQFRAEVSTIGTKQHINLVRLRGFCSEGAKKLLVYEYLEKKSLDCHLFSKDDNIILSWKRRYQIALGTARGLAYLHESCRDVIIHCDIKPENILLDADFCPKVADFGLAKLMGRNFSRVLTTVRGTWGYLAPEWLSGVAITPKADVYSYGKMVFELISGKRNSECSDEGFVSYFPSSAAQVMVSEGDMLSLLDPRLDGQGDMEEVSRLCKVACWCVQDSEAHGPSMGQVVQILEQVLDVNVPSVPDALRILKDDEERLAFYTEQSTKYHSVQSRLN